MSHFSLIKIKIKNPNVSLLKKTVEQIAKELNGTIVTEIVDYNRNVRTAGSDFIVGMKNDVFHRGVGIAVNKDGEVELIGDFWNIPQSEIQKLQQLLVQYYAKNAMTLALSQLNYHVQETKQSDKILIVAEAII